MEIYISANGGAGTVNTGGGGGGTTYGGNLLELVELVVLVVIRWATADGTITVAAGLTSSSTTDGSDTVVTYYSRNRNSELCIMSELKTNKISTNDQNNVAIDNALGLKSYIQLLEML